MFVRIQNLLNKEQLSLVDELIGSSDFVDGSGTTGEPTKAVKHNLQIELAQHPKREEFLRMITQIINKHPVVRATIVPKKMTVPLISKYQTGMAYGWHVDNAIMAGMGTAVRTDVACTLFLSNSDSYEGGELVVRSNSGDVKVKLERGDAFFYPATSRHQVTEVTRGERLAIVFWIQSMIADPGKREILYDLELAYDRLRKDHPTSEAAQMIQRAQSNLVRRWSEV